MSIYNGCTKGWAARNLPIPCLTYRTTRILPSETKTFTLVNSTGHLINGRELGLLLYGGGTVCDDSFDNIAANAICKKMNYTHAMRWTSRKSFDIQVDVNV